MIAVLMRNENCLHLIRGQTEVGHPLHGFTAGQAGVDEHGFVAVADVVTVSVTAGIKGCNKQGHAEMQKYEEEYGNSSIGQ